MIYDLIIIGFGAAGFGAVIYGGRYRMKVLVIGKEFGGETASAGSIENYPGVPAINGRDELIVDGLFVEVGAIPNVELAKSLGVLLDEHGYIKVDNMMQTNVDGVFAAGDEVNHFGSSKQDITAAAMGAVAATSVYNDHKIHGELCVYHARPTMDNK